MLYKKGNIVYNISTHDYERIEFIENSNHDSFKILTGKYSGTVITYGKIAITEPTNPDIDEATLSFEYVVNKAPSGIDETFLESDSDFNNYLGDMLQCVIAEALDNDNYAIGNKENNDNPDNNFTKSIN